MGAGVSRKHDCENCQTRKLLDHVKESRKITCDTCGLQGFKSKKHLEKHFSSVHGKINNNFDEEYDLCDEEETNDSHIQKGIACPKCDKNDFKDGAAFVQHLRDFHSFTSKANIRAESEVNLLASPEGNKKMPKIGEKVLAMWSQSKWQYFHATILRFLKETLRYEIDWDDGDTTGRIVDYFNIAVDREPDKNEIGIGSVVLFPQGQYTAGASQLTGGCRWHQGRITKIYKRNGKTYYDGVHTKGNDDGKFVTYKGYLYEFVGKELHECRVGPNVFDLIGDSNDSGNSVEDIDIYFSYAKNDSPSMFQDISPGKLCDPAEIVSDLKITGLSVADGSKNESNGNLKEKVVMMKNSKVFVACISDQYVLNEQCRMEFQYAKATLKKPVVPLVIGDGMEWMMSVVGMLIAGELYIHFKDKTVHSEKCKEILKSLSRHITTKDGENINQEEQQGTEMAPGEIFISYAWSNSYLAKESNQIDDICGTKYSDPRLISQNISTLGHSTWLDIERLTSADKNAGLFEQLAKALKDAKVVVPFISNEYAKSLNCRMEFQFAWKSLAKPVIPVIVGKGDDWKQTVVGLLISSANVEPICFQNVDDEGSFQLLLDQIKERLNEILGDRPKSERMERDNLEQVTPPTFKSRVPQPGDHVVCHHFNYCYYMATVVGYNISTMEYTVEWDDGDPSGRVQMYDQVAVDVVPALYDVGVGSVIFFPQGSYGASEGNNSGGVRYHEGIITRIGKEDGQTILYGHHTRGLEDGKAISYRSYDYNFEHMPMDKIRIAPSALDTVGR